MTMEYSSDLDDKTIDLQIEFNSSIINSPSQTMSLKMKARNGLLTYESSASLANYKIFNTFGIVIGVLCFVLYLVSSYFHKMIGL